MIVKSMNESAIYAIGHAFGYYDYGGCRQDLCAKLFAGSG